ncbi:MAG: branched-chain amino acid ABC transporter permease [Chloroflexota bacterium]|nr:branched-chain amino acid ABC transporter permease [Chloroflexota bacterium]
MRRPPLIVLYGITAAILIGVALLLSDFYRSLLTEMLIAGLFALSLNLIMGYGGMVSFGHAAFYGLGGYAVGILTTRYGVDPFVAMALAPFVAALGALIIGWFAVRRVRLYFSILTLAFGQVLYTLVFNNAEFTGGDNGLLGIPGADWLRPELNYFLFALAIFALCFAALRVLIRSPFILTLRAIRENPERAQFIGVDVRRHQLIVFVIGGFFAGVAGMLLAGHNRIVGVDMLFWTTSSQPLLGSLMGGMFSLVGPVVGGAILRFLEVQITTVTLYWPAVLGVLTVGFVLLAPDGLVGLVDRWTNKRDGENDS